MALLTLLFSPRMALAFPDSYEPDDNQEQATIVEVSRGFTPRASSGQVQGIITDAYSGKPIEGAIVYSNCNENDASISFADGNYALIHNCPSGLYALTAEAFGYQTLTCHTPIATIISIQRDIALLPDGDCYSAPTPPAQLAFRNGDTLRASQPLYHNGEQLKVEFQLDRLGMVMK